MGRMIDFDRHGCASQNLKSPAHSRTRLFIPIVLLVSFFIFKYCSVLSSEQDSKELEILKYNKNKKKSILEKGKKGVKVINEKLKETRWAICIGINDYEDRTIIDLKKARNDARELAMILKQYGRFDHIFVFTDDYDSRNVHYPNKNNIKRKLKFLKEIIKPEDMILFSFSGHGMTCSDEEGNNEGSLLTVDSYIDDSCKSSLKVKYIVDWIKETKVKKALLLLDACREKFQKGKGVNRNGPKTERFAQAELAAIFYATWDGGFSYEDEEGEFGIFTKYIIKGLKGEADTSEAGNRDSIVVFSELVSYVEEKIAKWALKENKMQIPYTHQIFKEKFGDLVLSILPPQGNKIAENNQVDDEKFHPTDVNAKSVELTSPFRSPVSEITVPIGTILKIKGRFEYSNNIEYWICFIDNEYIWPKVKISASKFRKSVSIPTTGFFKGKLVLISVQDKRSEEFNKWLCSGSDKPLLKQTEPTIILEIKIKVK